MSKSSHKSICSGFRDSAQRGSLSYEDQLFMAIDQGDPRKVRHLLGKGVSVNAIHPTGRTPLGAAAHNGNVEVLKMLLEPREEQSSKNTPKNFNQKWKKPDQEVDESCDDASYHGKASASGPSDRRMKGCIRLNDTQVSKLSLQSNCKSDSLSSEDESVEEAEKNLKYHKRYRGENKDHSKTNHSVDQHDSDGYKCRHLLLDDLQSQNYSFPPEDDDPMKQTRIETNQGYYIVVHSEYSPEGKKSDDEPEKLNCDEKLMEAKTPDGMDNLEWDSEVQLEIHPSSEEDLDSDSWVGLYRWYADYLAEVCGVDRSVKPSKSTHIDVNQLDIYRRSAMHYAAESGNMEVLRVLLSAGCAVDIGDADDITPLHLAAARDYPETVALLISCGAKVNRKSVDGTGPLHMAAARGFMETVRILLEHGACVNAADRSDRTPLHLAVTRGLEDMSKLLISHKAKVNVEDILGYTPLCQAVWQQEKRIVKLLLSAGAKLTHSDRLLHCAILHRCPDIAELLISAGSIVNLRDDSGDTPLIIAARSGQTDMVKLLLRNGAMASYPNGLTGSTPLHEAVECLRPAQYSELKEIILTLLNHCGPSGLLNAESSSTYDTPLVRALVHDRDHAMILLIQHGADVNVLQKHTSIVSEEYLLNRPNRWIIAHLMVCAGVKLWDCTNSIRHEVKYPEDSYASWIASVKFNPMSLRELTRLKYRRHYGENVFKAVNRSGLPKRLIKYIMLEDQTTVEEYLRCSSNCK